MTEPAPGRQTPDRQTSPPPPPPRASGAPAGLGLTSWAELHDRRMQEPGAVEAYQEAEREMEAEAKLAERKPVGVFAPPPPEPAANLDEAIAAGVEAAYQDYEEIPVDADERTVIETMVARAVKAAAPILQAELDQLRSDAEIARDMLDDSRALHAAHAADAQRAIDRLTQDRDEAKAAIRWAHKAIRDGAVDAGTVALALFKVGDTDEPSILDERDEARRALEQVTAERDQLRVHAGAAQRIIDRNEEIKTTIRWNQERADNAERRCRKLTVAVEDLRDELGKAVRERDEWKAQVEAAQAEAEAVLAALEPKMGQLEQVLRETHGAVERLVKERDELLARLAAYERLETMARKFDAAHVGGAGYEVFRAAQVELRQILAELAQEPFGHITPVTGRQEPSEAAITLDNSAGVPKGETEANPT